MNSLYYDFHIHSCLSPCASEDMTPANIVGMAVLKGLDAIAITDHNSCLNCGVTMTLGERYGLTVLPGMELCTTEEVHVICLFPTLSQALDFGAYVDKHILFIKNEERIFGKQQVVDIQDTVTSHVPNLLINATNISFHHMDTLMADFGGIYIPAHIDKPTTSLLSNLGFIPPTSRFSFVETKSTEHIEYLKAKHAHLQMCHFLHNSDAHYLGDIQEARYKIQAKSSDIKDIFDIFKV